MATLAVGISLLMFACFMFIHSLSAVRDISVPSIKYELMKAIRAHSVCRMRLLFMDCEKVAFVGCVHFPREFLEILKEGKINIDVYCCQSSTMCKERNVHMFGSSIRVHCNVPFTPALAKKFKVIVADASCDNGCLVSEVHAVDPTIQVKWTHPRTLVFLDGKNEVTSYTEGNNKGAEAFSLVYEGGVWTGYGDGSGPGSTMKYTTNARSILKQVLSNSSLGILSMVDSPCGSFHWMPSVIADFPHIQYTGIDIACSVIEGNVLKHRYHSNMKFYCLDMCHQEIPQADLVFSRDALQHLPFEFVFGFLAILKKSGAKWALLGGYPLGPGNLVGARMENGDFFPIDLTRPPFNVTGVVKVFSENSEDVDKKHLFLIDVANMKWSRFNS